MKNENNEILEKLTTELDISESVYEQVVARYISVGEWLGRPESTVAKYDPIIYPQGSVELGTVVKPINDEDEYDIDLVCELVKLEKHRVTQQQLKTWVGSEIRDYTSVNGMNSKPYDARRCWTLNYSDTSRFHLDILPAIPDGLALISNLKAIGFSNQWASHAIAITDKESLNYDQYSLDWSQSNPKGYAMWFRSRMPNALFEAKKANVDHVTYYKIKSPLQQAIQILKRHRDMMFADDLDDKPISIIITTLAAHAYNQELVLSDALIRMVNYMGNFIEMRNNIAYIPNPSNPKENFADKWQKYPRRQQNFSKWLSQVKHDFNTLLLYEDSVSFVEALAPILGERAVNRAAAQVFEKTETRSLNFQKAVQPPPQFFIVPHKEKPKWPEALTGEVAIECVKRRDGFRSSKLLSGIPVSKHWSLIFQANTKISHPYQVFWQVVNTGVDAQMANQLRGGFYDGATFKGARQWKESTLYTGRHWIECFIIKNGAVAAKSGGFVVNIE
jgi:hypothetical protein